MTADTLATVGRWVAFAAQSLFTPPSLVSIFRFLFTTLIGSWPLAFVAGLSLGIVVWVHTRGVLAQMGTGAVEILPTVLSSAVLLELAPLGAGLILAARMGAALAAELAAMKQTEQLDALALVGTSPIKVLVAPRVWACMLAAPLVHVFITVLALGSGYVAESVLGNTSWLRYERALLEPLHLQAVLAHGAKTLVFGLLVGITGCFVGMNAKDGSTGVGTAATTGVVASAFLVLVADVFLVGLIRAVGLG